MKPSQRDFMGKAKCVLDFDNRQLRIKQAVIPFEETVQENRREIHIVEVEEIAEGEEPNASSEKVKQVLNKYGDVFSDVPGKIPGYQHRIKLTSDAPHQVHNYPIPFQYRREVDMQIKKND